MVCEAPALDDASPEYYKSRCKVLELENAALKNALRATRLTSYGQQSVNDNCRTCGGLRKLLTSATKVLEEREHMIKSLEERLHMVGDLGDLWACRVCGHGNKDVFPRCTNPACGSPRRQDNRRPSLPASIEARSSPHSYQQAPDRSATADLRPVQCGCCRSALVAPSGSVVDCPTCGTEIAIPTFERTMSPR
ncbi:hypothetical protein DIPPA_06393 [Diplonema papillatum]|nr:hypothetical protein DIPPA_06393 [Diplonema papillatum]